jgi:hypothetical protein
MIAKQYGQDPRAVAAWEPDWIAAALTVISAENAAANERQRRDERRSKMRQGR